MSDELIRRLRERSQGRTKWFAMNKAETAYFIDFDSSWDAQRWLDDQQKRMSEWLEREGVHIVKQRVFSELETLAGEAADALESASKEAIRREAMDSELSLQALYEDACIEANKNAQDAGRYRWLRDRYTGFDFDWMADDDGKNGKQVICFGMDEGMRIGRDVDAAIDDAIRALSQKVGDQQ